MYVEFPDSRPHKNYERSDFVVAKTAFPFVLAGGMHIFGKKILGI